MGCNGDFALKALSCLVLSCLVLSCLVLVLVASLQWISQQRCVRPATKGKTYTAGLLYNVGPTATIRPGTVSEMYNFNITNITKKKATRF